MSLFTTDIEVLDEDADEILLGLLARDNEPPPKHKMPHRRWVYPGFSEDGYFRRVAPGWWRIETWAEMRADQARRAANWKVELERNKALLAEVARQKEEEKQAWKDAMRRADRRYDRLLTPWVLVETQRLVNTDGWPEYWQTDLAPDPRP